MLHDHETKSSGSLPAERGEIKENKAVVKGLLQGKAEDMRVNQIYLKYKGSIFVFSACPDLFSCSLQALPVHWVSHCWLRAPAAFGCVGAHHTHTEQSNSLNSSSLQFTDYC